MCRLPYFFVLYIILVSLPKPRRIGGDNMEDAVGFFLLNFGASMLANLLITWWQNREKDKK